MKTKRLLFVLLVVVAALVTNASATYLKIDGQNLLTVSTLSPGVHTLTYGGTETTNPAAGAMPWENVYINIYDTSWGNSYWTGTASFVSGSLAYLPDCGVGAWQFLSNAHQWIPATLAPSAGDWMSINFNATVTGLIGFEVGYYPAGGNYDNWTTLNYGEVLVPEPVTMVLLALGAIAMRRRG